MSSEQQTLTDSAHRESETRTLDSSQWQPAGGNDARSNRCQNCNRHVHPDTTRVFATDEHNQPEKCFGCAPAHQIHRGGAAGKETRKARSQGWGHRGGGKL